MIRRPRRVAHFLVPVLLVAACNSATGSTAPSQPIASTVPSSTSTTSLDGFTELMSPTAIAESPAFDPAAASWTRQVVLRSGSPQLSGWYRDISSHPIGFIAAGVERDGLFERPMGWLGADGLQWIRIDMPDHLEGRFTAVANDGEVSVFVGYDTLRQAGLIVRVPRGSDPIEVSFTDPVELVEVVSTADGFVAYGLADPTSPEPRPVLYTSADGSAWDRVEVLPLAPVVEVVEGHNGYLLEIQELGLGQSVRLRRASSLFDSESGELVSWDVELPLDVETGFAYARTAMATDRGFLIGGGDGVAGRPMLWQVDLPEDDQPLVAEFLELEAPSGSQLFGAYVEVQHLTRFQEKLFAVVSAYNGRAEVWSAADPSSWVLEDTIGVHPTSPRYASAQSQAEQLPSVAAPGTPLTVVVTDGGFPGDLWIFGERVSDVSDLDLVAYQQPASPLLIGAVDGAPYARVVEHAPRWSQAEPDVVRTLLYSVAGSMWEERGATAWDRESKVQSIVQLGSRAAAFGTADEGRRGLANQAFPIAESGLGAATDLEGPADGLQMFDAAATTRLAVVVGTYPDSTWNRIGVWASGDLMTWERVSLEETQDAYVGAVCAGIDRVWILGRQANGFFSSARAWSTVDGATWSGSVPAVPGSDTPGGFTACAGDDVRVIAAVAPSPALMTTSDGLSWQSVDTPPGLLSTDRIVEVTVDGSRVGIVVLHPKGYFQPYHSAWLWDGVAWHQLEPEPGVDVDSIALSDGVIYLAGQSVDGATLWQQGSE